ncbi:MAG: hypothetical protein CMG57_01840 [Candidatus Marinimicrobia bacterium]|nr:hypothetical protein [Candidatus Neomarinimicrobiota bacterium]
MNEEFPDIRSVVIRVITNKPVRKTPYQVKGVFMRQYPDEPIIPMLDGSYRDRFLYPRVQVKILNEQIYIIGVHEGVDSVLSLAEKFKEFDFGNITFEVQDTDIEDVNQQFIPSSRLVRYRFITPWVALNHMTGGRYRFLTNQEKPSFLNRLLGQNIIFLANEVGVKLEDDIFTKVKVSSLFPRPVDENKWGAFMGEFKTNFVLPNYIGVGNGITRGFGTIYGMFNPDSFSFDEEELQQDVSKKSNLQTTENFDDLESVSATDVPKPSRRRRNKNKNQSFRSGSTKNKRSNKSRHHHKKHYKRNETQKHHLPRTGRVFSEEFDIEDESSENREDEKFNTSKHHKRQHKF